MADRIKEIILDAADAAGVGRVLQTEAGEINLDGDWAWMAVYPGLSDFVGQEITPETRVAELLAIAAKHEVKVDAGLGRREARGRALRRAGRTDPAQPDFRLRLPAVRAAAGPPPPRGQPA